MISESPYHILGLSDNATVDEIKKAYRAKAFLVHPDKNPSATAQQEFIELTEAYEEAIAAKTNSFKKYTSPFEDIEKRQQREREAAKLRAREYAQMRYEEFEKTEAAQTINSLNVILNHVMFLFVIVMLVSLPVVVGYLYPVDGTIVGIVFVALVAWPAFGFIKPLFNIKELWLALNKLLETLFFRMFILSVLNIYLYVKVVLNTLLQMEITLLIFVALMLSCYFYFLKNKKDTPRLFFSFSLFPLILNGLFCLNYVGSSHPKIETYEFWNDHNTTRRGRSVKNTMIHLKGGYYEEYQGIRMFSSLAQMSNCNHIIYQFEDGLLGVRVMKEYRFIP
jgi:hypothetical protein